MNYRSIAQLSDQIWAFSSTLPQDFDLVVGIPRSGLLAACILGLYRNLPIADVEGFIEGRLLASGKRYKGDLLTRGSANKLKVLVLDDSVYNGEAIRKARTKIESAKLQHEVHYAAIYVLPGAERHVDYYAQSLDSPRVFEWNILQRRLDRVCMDIDGVLCGDPASGTDDDGERYQNFLSCANPHYIPTEKVGWLVTCRLEKYRALTEAWLAKHSVQYGELIMMDFPNRTARRSANTYSAFKADAYRRTDAKLFFESSLNQAVQIANLALKPVFCVDTMQMIYPGNTPRDRYAA